jgi:DNA-binding SARP family transcriptional activator/tetratricopeptide (TPR) repeat protein
VLEIRLLGPVTAVTTTGPIPLGGGKPRALLAALVLERGRVVPLDRLVDLVWPENPPGSARALVQTYVSTLRKSFARHGFPDLISTVAPGYLARLEHATVDVELFADLVERAQERTRAADHESAAELLRRAVGLHQGPALGGLEASALSGEARRLEELLLHAQAERIDAELSLGRLDHLAELTLLATRHTTDERLWAQLMRTLHRLGRRTDALACFRQYRQTLIEELGVEPGPRLQELHGAILRGEELPGTVAPVVDAPDPTVPGPPDLPTHSQPAQLPPVPADFTGRDRERQTLATTLSGARPGIHVIAGAAGTGKSALAACVAQQVAESFPDGQVYCDLAGMSESPAAPTDVLAALLRSLGVTVRHLPESERERSELVRSKLAGRRVLLLLDDAASPAQVRPLLPGEPRCGVLVTSRDRLASLSGATLTELDVFTDEEARSLLARIVGTGRLDGDRGSADRILAACENLPLAIRIAAARLAARRQLPLSVFADRLGDERRLLDELAVGDMAVRSSIALSYRALTNQAQAALRRMGFVGAPEFTTSLVGWLLDTTEHRAEELLELLVDAHLVVFVGVGPGGALLYRLHNLVQLYARERAEIEEPAEALRDAVRRVLTGWLDLMRGLTADTPPAEVVRSPATQTNLPVPDDPLRQVLADPTGWLRWQEAGFAAGIERAAALGLHETVCEVVSARIAVELEGANRFEFRARVVNAALDAAVRAGDPRGEAMMLTELGHLRCAEDRHAEAWQHFGEALSRFRDLHDVIGQAAALAGLGLAGRESGNLSEAVHFLNQAAALLEALDDANGIGYVHRIRATVLLEQGQDELAQRDLERSLDAYRRSGSRRGTAYTLRSLGVLHRGRGEHAEALRACAEAADIFRDLGDELMHSYAVRSHATAQLRMGLTGTARPRLEWALSVARDAADRWGEAITLRVLGQLHLADGRLDQAEGCLAGALPMWEAMGARLWHARTEYDLSRVYHERGQADASEAAAANACRVFHDVGSREHTRLCRADPPR